MKNKKTIMLIAATVITLILAVIAVVTSLKLKELATVPVAPNVPVSKPRAAIPECNVVAGGACVDGSSNAGECCLAGLTCVSGKCQSAANACETTFTVAEKVLLACYSGVCVLPADCAAPYDCQTVPGSSPAVKKCVNPTCPSRVDCVCINGLACTTKSAFKTSVAVANKLAESADVRRGDKLVYEIAYENTGDSTNTMTITDVIDAKLKFVSADTGCLEANRTVTCANISVLSKATGTKKISVEVLADAAVGAIANSATITPTTGTTSKCAVSLNVKVDTTVAPKCNDTCTSQDQCPSDLKCINGNCRKEACSGQSGCNCPLKCNDYCANTSDCPSGYSCEGNKCRNAQCKGAQDCNCAKPPGCNEKCNPTNLTNECVGGYVCDKTSNSCRNAACLGKSSCQCDTATTTTTVKTTPPPEKLPVAGNMLSTILFIGAGGILAILGMVLVGL